MSQVSQVSLAHCRIRFLLRSQLGGSTLADRGFRNLGLFEAVNSSGLGVWRTFVHFYVFGVNKHWAFLQWWIWNRNNSCLFSKVSGQAASCSASESDKGLVSQKAAGSRFCPLFCFARFSSQALIERLNRSVKVLIARVWQTREDWMLLPTGLGHATKGR